MELKDLMLMHVIHDKRHTKLFSEKSFTGFGTSHSILLFKSFHNLTDIKYFHITDTTKKRLDNVPVEEINGSKLINLKSNLSAGLVFFNDGLHFIYLIRNNGVYIMSSRCKYRKKYDDPLFAIGQIMSGFLYYDFYSDLKCCYLNNILDVINNPDHLIAKDFPSLQRLRKIRKLAEKGNYDLYNLEKPDLEQKYADTKLCLQAFMFIHFAKVINTTRVSKDYDTRSLIEKINHKEIPTYNVIEVDTFYDETMRVINPFSVKGHFRNQPFGVGLKETKLIYIDSFMKTGYTRTATKEKINL